MPVTPNCNHLGSSWVWDALDKECCYDYTSGISCLGAAAGVGLDFNFCEMQCDNGYLQPGETVLGATSPYSDYITSITPVNGVRYGYLWSPNTNGWPINRAVMDYVPACRALVPAISLNPGVPSFLSSGYYYCADASGMPVDCGVTNTAPDSGTYPTIMNPAAMWIVSASWFMMGCGLVFQPIQNHQRIVSLTPFPNINYTKQCSFLNGNFVVWIGCPSGFTQQSNSGLATYGTGYQKDECEVTPNDLIHRTPRTYVPSSFRSGYIGVPNYPTSGAGGAASWASEVEYGSHAYDPGEGLPGSEGCTDIATLTATLEAQLGCYEPFRSGCPPASDSGSPPCYFDCEPGQCPPGYFYDATSGLCIEGYNQVSKVRGFAGKELMALVNSAKRLKIYQFSNDQPRTMQENADLGVVELASLETDKSGTYWAIYSKNNDVYYRINRDSGNGTWGTEVALISGYRSLHAKLRPTGGGWLFLLWKESDSKLYAGVAESAAGGSPVNLATPVKISDDLCLPSGDFTIDKSGGIHLTYVLSSGSTVVNRVCRDISKTGTGSWALV